MNIVDIIILIFVLAIIFLVIFFNIKSLKSNNKCSKCPYAKTCQSQDKISKNFNLKPKNCKKN